MTTPSTARKAGPFTGNGSQSSWPFTFKVFAATDVKVTAADATGAETVLVLGTDYTVALNSNQDTSPGGTVTHLLGSGHKLTVTGDLDYDQPLDIPGGGNFNPVALENQLDRMTMQVQQIKEEVDRSAKMPATASTDDIETFTAGIVALSDSVDEITAVAANVDALNTVASDLTEPVSEINTVAAAIANVNAVGNNIANVNTVAEIGANVTTVAGIQANVTAVAGIQGNVTAVAGISADVTAVADNVADVTTVADNLADITNFADVYYGPSAANPTTRRDDSALQDGDLYYNTGTKRLRVYNGTTWVDSLVDAGTITLQRFSGNGSTTAFTLASAPTHENNTQVFIGGVYQQKDQYSVSGTTLTFSSAPPSGTDNIEVVTITTLAIGQTDSALVSFIPGGPGAVQRTAEDKLLEFVSVLDYGADPTGVADSTAAIQAAVDFVQSVGATDPHNPAYAGGVDLGRLCFPAGVYKITAPINITKPCVIYGEGIRRTVIRFATSNTALHAFNIGPTAVGQNLIGGSFGGMSIIGNAGSVVGSGVAMSTAASASGLTLFTLHDLGIYNVRKGVSQTGVIYMCTFRNITVSGTWGGTVMEYGWYVTSPQEVIYNSYTDLEVTVVGDGAYAYWFQVFACQFRNLTADGVAYFSNFYGALKGFTIEGINATTTPSNVALQLNQCDSVEDVALINCPTAKTSIGLSVIGRSNIRNVRWPDNGAGNQPANPIYLHSGSKGTITGWQVGRAVTNKVEVGTAAADMNNWVFTACGDITDYDLTYKQDTWTPTFTGWTTAPTVISAQYTRIGRQVTVTLYATGGVNNYNGIGGLPVAANAAQGSAGVINSSSNIPLYAGCSVIPGASAINGFNVTMTGAYWQLTATYFV